MMNVNNHFLLHLDYSKAEAKAEALVEVEAVIAKKAAEAKLVVAKKRAEAKPVVAKEEVEVVLPIERVQVDSPIVRVHCLSLIPLTDPYSPCFSYQRLSCSLPSFAYCFGYSSCPGFTILLACSTRTTPTSFLPHDASSPPPPLTNDADSALTSLLDWDAFVPSSPSSKFSGTP
jgi:hypothetical protein